MIGLVEVSSSLIMLVVLKPTPSVSSDFGFGSLDLTVEDFSSPGKIVQLGYEPNRVDFITSIGDVSFDEDWAGRVEGNYGSQPVFFLGLRELIRAKEAAGRPRDLADLEWLRQLEEDPPTG